MTSVPWVRVLPRTVPPSGSAQTLATVESDRTITLVNLRMTPMMDGNDVPGVIVRSILVKMMRVRPLLYRIVAVPAKPRQIPVTVYEDLPCLFGCGTSWHLCARSGDADYGTDGWSLWPRGKCIEARRLPNRGSDRCDECEDHLGRRACPSHHAFSRR
jgi:hypothetical protein